MSHSIPQIEAESVVRDLATASYEHSGCDPDLSVVSCVLC